MTAKERRTSEILYELYTLKGEQNCTLKLLILTKKLSGILLYGTFARDLIPLCLRLELVITKFH